MKTHLLRTGLQTVALGGLLTVSMFGQSKGGGVSAPPANPGVGSSPGGNTSPGRTLPNTPTPSPGINRTPGDFGANRPFFISGKVTMEDGSAPPELVNIERICGSRTLTEGHTDRKGRFSVELGRSVAQFADASNSSSDFNRGGMSGINPMNSGVTEQSLMNCEIRASLPGYRSTTVNLAGRRSLDNPEVGTLVLHRIGGDKVEGLTISMTNVLAPKDAKKEYEKGSELMQKGKADEAMNHLQKAVEIYPKYASAWLNLGLLQNRRGEKEAAQKSFQSAIDADPKFVPPYVEMTAMAAKNQDWKHVQEISQHAMKLDPFGFPQEYLFNAIANLNLNNLDDAEKSAREGLKLDTDHKAPQLEHVLGVVLVQKKEYTEAATHIQTYLKLSPNASNADLARKQLAEIQSLVAENEKK